MLRVGTKRIGRVHGDTVYKFDVGVSHNFGIRANGSSSKAVRCYTTITIGGILMKIVCIADIHVHKFAEFDRKTDWTGSHRLDVILRTLLTVKEYCEENKIYQVVMAGDIYNVRAKVDIEVQNHLLDVMESFHAAGIKVLVIAGNHDQYDNSDSPANATRAFRNIPGFTVVDSEGVVTLEEGEEVVKVLCVPYNKDTDRLKGAINLFVEENPGDTSSILAGHLGVTGGYQGTHQMSDSFTLQDLHPEYFKYIVLGHYHTHQALSGSKNAFYCGSPVAHSFNEEGEDKGFVVIDTSKRYDVSFVRIPNPEFHTVNSDISPELLQKHADNGDYLRLKLKSTEVQDFLAKVPQGLNYKTEIEKEYKAASRSDVKIGMSFDQIVSSYAEQYMPEAKKEGLEILKEVGGAK